MTNLDKWRFYMKDCTAPDCFIDWSYYSMIATALQRKVFIGDMDADPLFPNLYVILTADSGIGKGISIHPVNTMLRLHKREGKDNLNIMADTPSNQYDVNIMKGEVPLLIPMGSDAITYEALVSCMSKTVSCLYPKSESGCAKKMYMHSSIGFVLQEMSSLFRQKTEDLVNFLVVAYDCKDYRYETKHLGKDFIKNCCLNLLAGTTPAFIKRIFNDDLIAEGFASRAIFVCALCPREYNAFPVKHSEEQKVAHAEVAEHIKILGRLFGKVSYPTEVYDYVQQWWRTEAQVKKNQAPHQLRHYYARGS